MTLLADVYHLIPISLFSCTFLMVCCEAVMTKYLISGQSEREYYEANIYQYGAYCV
jgi:hypothetical protein